MQKFLIAGLGNIGTEYAGTRHNIGFDVLDELARRHGASYAAERYGDLASFNIKGRNLNLLKPNTFMNLSGKAVKYWMDKLSILPEQILVVVDDIALPVSRIRIRKGGSSGGHNGLKSIEEHLKTQEYAKLRFGVGNDFAKGRQADYVLAKWDRNEVAAVNQKIGISADAIESFVLSGADNTMNQFNKITVDL
jgi:PTH1 family peptidyl-tRNA hydrolase